MEIETVQHFNYDQFIESSALPEVGNTDIVQEEEPVQLKRDNRAFAIAGGLSILAGAGIFLASNFGLGLTALVPAMIGTGIAALGFGVVKAFRKIFRKKNLNLPSLQIRRKTERQAKPKVQAVETYRPGKKLAKSLTDRVFMGVCGGLAEHSGLSSSMIRMLFIAAFAFSGGTAAVGYMLLGLFLPTKLRSARS